MNETDSNKKPTGKQALKDYTSDLPMFDLEEALKLVTDIHEKALETASMPEVAKGCGYASPSSTPFYRRMVAARLFKLLSSQRAELTKLALDYLKPDSEDAKSKALTDSIMGIPAYAELIQSHQGKRINLEIVANGFMRKFSLTKPGASLCARAFASSIKTAGFLTPDGTLGAVSQRTVENNLNDPPPPPPPLDDDKNPPLQGFTLILDPKKGRKIVIQAPPSVSESELKRIQAWLGFQLLVVADGEKSTPTE